MVVHIRVLRLNCFKLLLSIESFQGTRSSFGFLFSENQPSPTVSAKRAHINRFLNNFAHVRRAIRAMRNSIKREPAIFRISNLISQRQLIELRPRFKFASLYSTFAAFRRNYRLFAVLLNFLNFMRVYIQLVSI